MKSISFTGHRSLTKNKVAISDRLYKKLEEEIQNEATDFNTGGTVGFDCISATVILKLPEIYPHIKLNLILPCSNYEQTKNWTNEEKAEFYRILSLANTVEYTSEHFFQRRYESAECSSYRTCGLLFLLLEYEQTEAELYRLCEWQLKRK